MWIRELATGWERVYKPSEHASASVTRGTRDAVPTATSPSHMSDSALGTLPLMPTIRLNQTDTNFDFIWTATIPSRCYRPFFWVSTTIVCALLN
jgi:hypothetical protein